MSQLILHIAVPTPLRKTFQYLAPDAIQKPPLPGVRVRVPFQRRELIGILIKTSDSSDLPLSKLKQAHELLDEEPVVTKDILTLCHWASCYYHYPIGEIIAAALPPGVRQGKTLTLENDTEVPVTSFLKTTDITLNDEQLTAIQTICQHLSNFQAFLLAGITGSGKTEVYLNVIAEMLTQDKQCLVLVPEIGLTPQTIARFTERFQVPMAILHSGLTEKQRRKAWLAAKNNVAKIVIGTRSAVFSPLPELGLIIIDEEHDISFKQQDKFRYSARDLALVRAQMRDIPIVLGTATPSLETLGNSQRKHFQRLNLTQRATGAQLPTFKVIDIRSQKLNAGLSAQLLHAMEKHLTAGNQILLFINRRGYAPVLMCHHCGWTGECRYCDAKLTLHMSPRYLQCHHCGSTQRVPTICPCCDHKELIPLGTGTEKLADALSTIFPDTPITRIDRDTTHKRGSLDNLLEEIQTGKPQILVGTQMLAKGHHFPQVTLVGIINTDSGFYSSDFRACERVGQLITQVAGRAGRATKSGEVYLQTHQPEHPLLEHLLKSDYDAFAEQLLEERKTAQLPPYAYQALFRTDAKIQTVGEQWLLALKQFAEQYPVPALQILGPIPATMAKRAGYYRYLLLLQTPQRKVLQEFLEKLVHHLGEIKQDHRVKWSLDVDPYELF